MKITFDNLNMKTASSHKRETTSAAVDVRDMGAVQYGMDAFRVMRGERKNPHSGTYGKEILTPEEMMQQLQAKDPDVEQMSMIVLSNTVSEEALADMAEDGYRMEDLSPEDIVTIQDHIKTAVALGGGDVAGYTDTLESETLESILGSAAYAHAVQEKPGKETILYMVRNDLEPTAENLFKASYSRNPDFAERDKEMIFMDSSSSQPENTMEEVVGLTAQPWPGERNGESAFAEQVENIIRDAGMEIDEHSAAMAYDLLQRDIPLTAEKLSLYRKIENYAGQDLETTKRALLAQISDGRSAEKADLTETENQIDKAVRLFSEMQELTLEDADAAAEYAEKHAIPVSELRLNDYFRVKQANMPGKNTYLQSVESRLQLEQVRLKMSAEVNLKLIRSGFQIDTAPMEKLIEKLSETKSRLEESMLPLADDTTRVIREMQDLPAAAIGGVVAREIPFTPGALHERGTEISRNLLAREKSGEAAERYDRMRTEVRADLGDSVKKAFRNVDDILTEMNEEPSEENRRAVRILGYNRIEINSENIKQAKEADSKLQNFFEQMNPGKVLRMIRDGIDILHTDIADLTTYMQQIDSEFLSQADSFARYLRKLDKTKEITPEERESLVGVFRMQKQLVKSDGASTGFLLAAGETMTPENLLTALRSGKLSAMNYKIDDSFAGLDKKETGRDISKQIASVYESREESRFLREFGQPPTVTNLQAAAEILSSDAGFFRSLFRSTSGKTADEYEAVSEPEKAEALESRVDDSVAQAKRSSLDALSHMDEPQLFEQDVETFYRAADQILREMMEKPGIAVRDIQSIQKMYGRIKLGENLAKQFRYQIPLELGEDKFAVLNLTVKEGVGERKATAEIHLDTNTSITGIFVMEEEGGIQFSMSEKHLGRSADLMAGISEKIKEQLGQVEERKDTNSVQELYRISKIFVLTVRNEYQKR